MLLIETILTLLAVALALLWPGTGGSFWKPIESRFVRVARRRKFSVILVGTTALALRVALLPVLPIPKPAIHDEFSYLLAGDTFAHWRLTNPPHPMWVHFETFHVIQQPTYASMYYPAQGMFLAAGQIIFHHPFWGVWLSCGLMCAAICWMLQAWVGPVWALLGGMLAVIRIAAFSYWDNSYWGGAVAALGGALILGALPRVMRSERSRDAVIMGLGVALFVNSRPYETVFFMLPVIAVFAAWIFRKRSSLIFSRVVLPLAIVLLATATFMAYYNWRTTGSILRSPYFVNLATYNSVPYFPWQQIKAPVPYHHATMQDFYLRWWLLQFQFGRLHPGMIALLKTYLFWAFFLGPLLTLPLLLALLKSPSTLSFRQLRFRTRFLLCVCGFALLGAALPVYFNPHYIAAITCAIYAFELIALQQLRRWTFRGRNFGLPILRAVPVFALSLLSVRILSPALHIPNSYAPATWCSPEKENFDRAQIISELSRQPGSHLIIVRYEPNHTFSNEWVYNGADIDGSKVIWARDMGEEENKELLQYFSQRRAWLVEPDAKPVRLQPYSEAN